MEPAFQRLSIWDKEDAELVIKASEIEGSRLDYNLSLLGRFMGERNINFNAMERTLLNLWRPIKDCSIKPFGGEGLYLFQFFHIVDLRKMMARGPWSFNNCILLVHQMNDEENPEDVEFQYADFWVRVHDLPPSFASESLAITLGNIMDTFLEYDTGNKRHSFVNYMRIRVRLNITEPLMRTKKIRKEGSDFFEVAFSYERIPLICYLCGIIGHSESNCVKLTELLEEEIKQEWPEEIRLKFRIQNKIQPNQWRRDPAYPASFEDRSNTHGISYLEADRSKNNRVVNTYGSFSKQFKFTRNVDFAKIAPVVSDMETSGTAATLDAVLKEKENTGMIVDEVKKRPRETPCYGPKFDEMNNSRLSSSSASTSSSTDSPTVGLDCETCRFS